MKILVVDDDIILLNALRLALLMRGHEAVTASNGAEALQRLAEAEREQPMAVVVTDLRMPGMTGLQLIRKARERHQALPGILMTAYGDRRTREAVRRLGDCAYLEKPFRPKTLVRLVEHAAEGRAHDGKNRQILEPPE